jgi:glycosyltransferase involved in cell wall biosynthesis
MADILFEISVILPVYNAEKYVTRAVESALQFPEVREVLLIEDGSPDNGLSVCERLAQRSAQVRLLQHPDKGNHGAGASRNLGLENARHPYIAFLDADDFYLPNRFDADKRVFAVNPDADGVYNALGVHYYSKHAEAAYKSTALAEITTVTEQVEPMSLFESFIYLNEGFGYFSLDGLTIKKELLDKMRYWFNPALRLHQDSEFLIRLAYTARLFPGEIRTPVVKRGVHGENRVVNVQFDIEARNRHQVKLWESLYDWAEAEKIPEGYRKQIYRILLIKMLLPYNRFFRFVFFIINALKDRKFFLDTGCYTMAHSLLFGDSWTSRLLLRIKNKLQRVLTFRNAKK